MAHPGREPVAGYPQRMRQWETPAPIIPKAPKVPQITPPPPPPSRTSKIAQVGAAVALVVTALGGSTILDRCTQPKPQTAEQGAAMYELQRQTDERVARIEKKFDAAIARQQRRNGILIESACKMNGGTPIARGAPCNELVWTPPPLGSSVPWVAREEWPGE